jgi:selenocysteine lyase/cysteine desulfurase
MLYAFPEEQGRYGSIVAFRPRSYPYDKLHQLLLEKHKIITRMVPENGINCNRISTHIYNTQEEVDRLVAAVTSVV